MIRRKRNLTKHSLSTLSDVCGRRHHRFRAPMTVFYLNWMQSIAPSTRTWLNFEIWRWIELFSIHPPDLKVVLHIVSKQHLKTAFTYLPNSLELHDKTYSVLILYPSYTMNSNLCYFNLPVKFCYLSSVLFFSTPAETMLRRMLLNRQNRRLVTYSDELKTFSVALPRRKGRAPSTSMLYYTHTLSSIFFRKFLTRNLSWLIPPSLTHTSNRWICIYVRA